MSAGLVLGRAFVEHQPVHAELPSRFGKIVEVDWLANVTVHSDLVAANKIALFIGRSKNNDGEHTRGFAIDYLPGVLHEVLCAEQRLDGVKGEPGVARKEGDAEKEERGYEDAADLKLDLKLELRRHGVAPFYEATTVRSGQLRCRGGLREAAVVTASGIKGAIAS